MRNITNEVSVRNLCQERSGGILTIILKCIYFYAFEWDAMYKWVVSSYEMMYIDALHL